MLSMRWHAAVPCTGLTCPTRIDVLTSYVLVGGP